MRKKIKESGSIVSWKDLQRPLFCKLPKSRTLVGGCFDILHYGHVVFLKKAKKKGKCLIVALESDEFIRQKKKKEPVHSQRQRAEILASLRDVDVVVLLPYLEKYEDYLSLVQKVRPQYIAITAGDKYKEDKRKQAASVGAKICTVSSFIKQYASSKIVHYATFLSD